jgi:succinoglycan biosynthesis transport protein ExoP
VPPEAEPDIVELELRDHLRPLARRKRQIVLVTLLVFGPALLWSLLSEPTYRATARVLVQAREDASLFQTGRRSVEPDPNRIVQTEVLVFESPQIKSEVRDVLGSAPPVSALQLGQTDVIEVIATDRDARRATEVANAYAAAYIDLRRQQAVAEVVSAAEQLQAKISELQRQIDATSGQQQNVLIDQQALFRQKLDQLQVDNALQQGAARLISDAAVPRKPISPDPVRTGIVSLVFGLVVGVGVAYAVEYIDDTIRSGEHVERVLPETTVIGMIPTVPRWRKADEAMVASIDDPSSAAAEAFRTLRTSLQFLFLERGIGTLQVTSPNAGDGKSSTVANLAVAMARAGSRVVVVDCDLRRPRLASFFDVDGSIGLTSVLIGEVTLSQATVPAPGLNRVSVLPAGPAPPNPSEVLATPRMAELVASLRATGAVVILDSPPVLPVTDALVLSSRADATVLVCAAGRTTRKQLRRAAELLETVKAPLVGVVLNAVPEHFAYKGSYEYGSYRRPKPRDQRRSSRTASVSGSGSSPVIPHQA